MNFAKYQHVERLGSPEAEGLIDLEEPCYVFPKIDGTNGSVWMDDGVMCFGSRNRQLTLDNDNQGFMATLHNDQRLVDFFDSYPNHRLYGEWLVPHTLKDYADDAWRQFYVFDVCCQFDDGYEYVAYDDYREMLDAFELEYIPPLAIVERGTAERFIKLAESNVFLMQEGKLGEGIVIKRYGFKNKYGRTTWAKVVRNEFKTKHMRDSKPPKLHATAMVEEAIVDRFLTEAMIDKVAAKIIADVGGWTGKCIPRLLHTCYYDLVREETWNFLKALKNPTVNFKDLQRFVIGKVKRTKPELF